LPPERTGNIHALKKRQIFNESYNNAFKIYNDFDEARFGELNLIKGIDGKIHSSDKLCHEIKID